MVQEDKAERSFLHVKMELPSVCSFWNRESKIMNEKPDQKVNHGEVGYFVTTILRVVLDSELPYFHL